MRKGLLLWVLSIFLFGGVAVRLLAEEDQEFSWDGAVAQNQSLFEQYSASIVDVAIYVKPNEYGRIPDFGVRYLCPNCGSYHTHSLEQNIIQRKPIVLPGFAVAEDKVVIQNTYLRPEWISNIEVRFRGEVVSKAEITAFFPDENAVELTLESPVDGLKPLVFAEDAGVPKTAFYAIEEDSLRICGTKPVASQDVKYNVTLGYHYLVCTANVLLLDEAKQPVTLAFQTVRKGGMDFAPPSAWERLSSEEYWGQEAALRERIAKSAFSISITLETEKKQKDLLRGHYFSLEEDENATSFETYGMLLKSGEVLVFQELSPAQTARLSKITITLQDNTEVNASFVGSLRRFGLLVVKPETPLEGTPLEFATAKECMAMFCEPVAVCSLQGKGGDLTVQCNRSVVDEVSASYSGVPLIATANGNRSSGGEFIFREDGRLCVLPARLRIGKKSYDHDPEPIPASLIGEMLASENPYDSCNVPRDKEEQNRMVANLGIQGQPLTKQMIQERHLEKFAEATTYSTKGMLVTTVQPGSLAESIGLQPDDVLLFFRNPDDYIGLEIEMDSDEGMMGMFDEEGGFPWEHYDELPEQYFEMIPQPWGTVRTKLNLTLSSFGIGNQVVVGLVRNNKFQEIEFTLKAIGDTFESAPRYRHRSMGFTVADLTPEVKGYFHIKDGEPGVVVAQIRTGSAASGAGLKPYEVIVAVDGEDVHDIKEFQELTNKKVECSFTVRRLVNSHVVKIKGKVGPVAQ